MKDSPLNWPDAACARPANWPEWWYSERRKDVQLAIEICHTCPVMERCLARAVADGEVWGVWGGRHMSEPTARGDVCRAGHDQQDARVKVGGTFRCGICYRQGQARAAEKRRQDRAKRRAAREQVPA